jgi:hypothetical protein
MSLEEDVEFVAASLEMLPPWQSQQEWWARFSELTHHSDGQNSLSMEYLMEKLSVITGDWGKVDRHDIRRRAEYVLLFFDNPGLYEHLDAVQGNWEPQIPGATGRRWAESLCAAAWRLLVATSRDATYRRTFSIEG